MEMSSAVAITPPCRLPCGLNMKSLHRERHEAALVRVGDLEAEQLREEEGAEARLMRPQRLVERPAGGLLVHARRSYSSMGLRSRLRLADMAHEARTMSGIETLKAVTTNSATTIGREKNISQF